MAIRDFLLPLVSYPKPTTKAAIEQVFRLSESLQSGNRDGNHAAVTQRVSAVVYEIEIETGLYFEGAHMGEFLEREARKSAANAQQLVQSFEDIAARHTVMHRCRLERRTPFDMTRNLVESARLHHVTVQPLRKDTEDQFDLAEKLIFESGRPVLIFPEAPLRPLATAIQTVAVAWDGSRQATRAVADALPFLRRAKTVRAFTATDDKPLSPAQAEQFVEYLAGFGIEAIHEDVKKTDQNSIGSFMESYVASRNVDLLVMGAYGHSRLREFILGGATRSILANPPCWVLLSH
ncbi:MAG: universal stress protein [Afipia sp.]|jgi:nucleotide-binding universal stress UspA family protein|nr:MAG: universal stress protein [Afipia sp.]